MKPKIFAVIVLTMLLAVASFAPGPVAPVVHAADTCDDVRAGAKAYSNAIFVFCRANDGSISACYLQSYFAYNDFMHSMGCY